MHSLWMLNQVSMMDGEDARVNFEILTEKREIPFNVGTAHIRITSGSSHKPIIVLICWCATNAKLMKQQNTTLRSTGVHPVQSLLNNTLLNVSGEVIL